MIRDRRLVVVVLVGAVALLIVVFVAGYRQGRHSEESGRWLTGSAYVGQQQLSVEVGGWAYGASDSVPQWIDAEGSWHEGGWPDCVDVKSGSRVRLTFQAREVRVGSTTTRPIVAVDCRSTD